MWPFFAAGCYAAAASIGISLVLLFGVPHLVDTSSACEGLEGLVICGAASFFAAYVVSLSAGIGVSAIFLNKRNIEKATSVSILASFTAVTFVSVLITRWLLNDWLYGLLSVLIFIASFLFYGWYITILPGKTASKIGALGIILTFLLLGSFWIGR